MSSCINHAINLAAAWFIKGLGIPSAAKVKHAIHGKQYEAADSTDDGDDGQEESDEDDVADEEFDVDVNPDLEANADDEDAMLGTTITDFEPGDVVGKVMAFVNQVRASSEPTRDFLKQLCLTNGCKPCDLKLWVKTRWGSLSDCFEVALGMRRAIDDFCVLADGRSNIPPLRKPKHWKDFRLSQDEWTIVELAYECLKVPASMHSQLSAEKTPTCHKVYPLIIQLIAEWEEYQDDPEYDLVKHALKVGLANIKKWYQTTKGSLMYFITHVLDPTRKLTFLEAAWEEDTLKAAKKNFEKIFLQYKTKYDAQRVVIAQPAVVQTTATICQASDAAGMDNFMDQFIKKKKPILAIPTSVGYENVNPLEEFKRYFARPCVSRSSCTNAIAWWGHQGSEYPVLQLIARDYCPIPGSSCLVERSFSLSARTDSARRGQMDKNKFGSLQRLRGAYSDGRLNVHNEAWIALDADFDYNSSDDLQY
ncbi:Ribonuclease H-like domain containing protein [Amanita muscaria]